MPNGYPYPEYQAKRSIVAGILLTLVTFGIYGLYWQYKQMATLNAWLERNEYSFWLWFFLSIITCGIFGIYYWSISEIGIMLSGTGCVLIIRLSPRPRWEVTDAWTEAEVSTRV